MLIMYFFVNGAAATYICPLPLPAPLPLSCGRKTFPLGKIKPLQPGEELPGSRRIQAIRGNGGIRDKLANVSARLPTGRLSAIEYLDKGGAVKFPSHGGVAFGVRLTSAAAAWAASQGRTVATHSA